MEEAPRIVVHAVGEAPAGILVDHVVADRGLAHLFDDATALHIALDGDSLHFHGPRRRRGIVAIDLVADQAADDGAGRGAAITATAAVAELVADDAADHRAQHGAGADGRSGIRTRHAAILVDTL